MSIHPAPSIIKQSGKVRIKVFWLTSIVLSVALSIIGTIVLNLILQ